MNMRTSEGNCPKCRQPLGIGGGCDVCAFNEEKPRLNDANFRKRATLIAKMALAAIFYEGSSFSLPDSVITGLQSLIPPPCPLCKSEHEEACPDAMCGRRR